MSYPNLRVLAYRGRTRPTDALRRIPITETDRKFMEKQKILLPNKYSKQDCRDLEHFLQIWEKRFMNKKADRLTDKYPVQKRDKATSELQKRQAEDWETIEPAQAPEQKDEAEAQGQNDQPAAQEAGEAQ